MQFAKQLDQIELRFEELSQQLADPDITSDGDRYRKAAKQHSDLSEMVALYREWKRAEGDIQQARVHGGVEVASAPARYAQPTIVPAAPLS